MGAYGEVISCCDRALGLYAERPPQDEVTRRDLAHIHERLGVARWKSGDSTGARAALQKGVDTLKGTGQSLPLAQTMLRWMDQGMHVDQRRLLAEQQRVRYFSVRRDTVDPKRALRIPDEIVERECPR